jgi:dienelactone hydrolase
MLCLVTIAGGGPELVGDLYLPDNARGPVPAVVTGSGFGGVKEMLLPVFGKALAEAGIAVLSIDYAGFGASAGEPRQEVDPDAQIQDLRRGLDYLSTHPAIDAARLGVWGPSMCGAHALVLAGSDPRVRAAVSIIPFVRAPGPKLSKLTWAIVVDGVRCAFGAKSRLVAASGEPGDLAVMSSDGALAWIREVSAAAPSFRNEVTLASLPKVGAYRPMRRLGPGGITVPLRTILAKDDSVTPAASARAELAEVLQNDIHEFAGTHFELFDAHLDAVVRLTVDWFARHLLAHETPAVASLQESTAPARR